MKQPIVFLMVGTHISIFFDTHTRIYNLFRSLWHSNKGWVK